MFRYVLFLTLCVLCFSCKTETPTSGIVQENDPQIDQFAKTLIDQITQGNANAFNANWDEASFWNQLKQTEFSQEEEDVINQSILGNNQALVEHLSSIGQISYTNAYSEAGKKHMVITHFLPGETAFYDFELSDKSENIKIENMITYSNGQSLSESISGYIELMKTPDPQGQSAFMGLEAAVQQFNAGEFDKAWDLFNNIPKDQAQQQQFRVWKLHLASRKSKQLHMEALKEFIDAYPDNKYIQRYYGMQLGLLEKNNEKLNEYTSQLEELVGKRGVISLVQQFSTK